MSVEMILQTMQRAPEYFKLIGLADILDMAIIAFGIYQLFRFVRRSRPAAGPGRIHIKG